jgi:hypothetical protein
MAKPSLTLITALRATAERLASGARYQWTHQGACNCGHLAQTLTRRSREEIHRIAVERAGDWGEHAIEYCPTSGYPIDHLLTEMLDAGLELSDVTSLERLDDRDVLRRLPDRGRAVDHRRREDVVAYLRAWADLLEEKLERHAPVIPLRPLRANDEEGGARRAVG